MTKFETRHEWNNSTELRIIMDNPNDESNPRLYVFNFSQEETKELMEKLAYALVRKGVYG